jgi:hypothetical protein
MGTMGNSEVDGVYPESGITESTRKMFEFIDDMFTPNYLKKERASHLYHLGRRTRSPARRSPPDGRPSGELPATSNHRT